MSYERCEIHETDATNGCAKCWSTEPDVARRALEERVAFAEQARDNAIKQRDDTLDRSKAKAKSAGDRISALVALVRALIMFVDKGTRDDAERQLTAILAKGDE